MDLELDDVSHIYAGPPPITALEDVSLQIAQGEMVAITGPSGSGKSTLLNILGLLDRPTSGEYRIGQQAMSTATPADVNLLRSEVLGFVFQAFHLIEHRTAIENVEIGLLYSQKYRPSERRSLAAGALEQVGLADRLHALPSELSGGQRQRVAIARAIAGARTILLCDEPTGNLDSSTAAAILEQLQSLADLGRSVIIATHDQQIADLAPKRFRVFDGVVTTGEQASRIRT